MMKALGAIGSWRQERNWSASLSRWIRMETPFARSVQGKKLNARYAILILTGTVMSGATGAQQRTVTPVKKKLWNLPLVKISPRSLATPTTQLASLTPCKQRPQQDAGGEHLEPTVTALTSDFDLRLRLAPGWGFTICLEIRLKTSTYSGGAITESKNLKGHLG